MKRQSLLIAAVMTAFTLTAGAQEADYTLRTLTFEDADYQGTGEDQSSGVADWSSLISDPQYGAAMLYGKNGYGEQENFYWWYDDNNTFLAHDLPHAWNNYCYMSGGHAISNYNSSDINQYSDYHYQLTVYNPDAKGIQRQGGGHNGSDNFAVHYGYKDNYNACDTLPAIRFKDGKERVIDHMYVNQTTYALYCYIGGNNLTAKIGDSDWVKLTATGYHADGTPTGTVAEMYLVNGPDNIIREWTKFDLSVLGPVGSVDFNLSGSNDNGYGFSQPAYFAYDDVAVRFPVETAGINGAEASTDAKSAVAPAYNLAGQCVDKAYKGVVVSSGKKVIRK